jgi:two-component system response regulator PilR (NtrC family)
VQALLRDLWLMAYRGQWQKVEEHLAALPAEVNGKPYVECQRHLLRGHRLMLEGATATAEREVLIALGRAMESGERYHVARCYHYLANIFQQSGQRRLALAQIRRAVAEEAAAEYRGRLLLRQARLAGGLGLFAEAEQALRGAREVGAAECRLAITQLVHALRVRDLDRMEELVRRVAAAPPPEDLGGRAWELACRASAAHECGEWSRALTLAREARAATRGVARHASMHALLAVLLINCRRELVGATMAETASTPTTCGGESRAARTNQRLLRLTRKMATTLEQRSCTEVLIPLLGVRALLLVRVGRMATAEAVFARIYALTAGREYPLERFGALQEHLRLLLRRERTAVPEPRLRELLDELGFLAHDIAHPPFLWANRVLRALAAGARGGEEALAELERCRQALRLARRRGEICRVDEATWNTELERHAARARDQLRIRLARDVARINAVMQRVRSESTGVDLLALAESIGRELAAERAACASGASGAVSAVATANALDAAGDTGAKPGHSAIAEGDTVAATAGALPPESSANSITAVVRVGRLLTRSAALRQILERIDRLRESTLPVLICGESGTGKELVARAVHDRSSRPSGPFVPVNCAAIPSGLLEAELFGHTRGAFTGATRDKRGFFVEASGGTLFLDEIGDLPLELQAKLLRVLEDRTVTPLGRTRGIVVDFRIVAATHNDLRRAVAAGRFRSDLYYRMQGLELQIPPLRERQEDLPLLVEHFLEEFRATRGLRRRPRLTPEAWQALERYHWPGNVRELRHAILVAAELRAPGRGPIALEALPPQIIDAARRAGLAGICAGLLLEDRLLQRLFGVVAAHGYKPVMKAIDRYILERALAAHDGNQRAAARSISIRESTLRQKSRRIGVAHPRS